MDMDNKVQGEPWDTDVRGLKNNGYDLDPNMGFFLVQFQAHKIHPKEDLKFQSLGAEQESEGFFYLYRLVLEPPEIISEFQYILGLEDKILILEPKGTSKARDGVSDEFVDQKVVASQKEKCR